MQNLTSYSCSATPIFCKGDKILRLSRLVFEIWRGTDRRQTRRPFHKCASLTVVSCQYRPYRLIYAWYSATVCVCCVLKYMFVYCMCDLFCNRGQFGYPKTVVNVKLRSHRMRCRPAPRSTSIYAATCRTTWRASGSSPIVQCTWLNLAIGARND